MPFTPLHLGPGLAVKALAGGRFSFMEYGFAQVLIDLEPLYYLLRQDPPLHRFLHTGLGASLALVLALVLGKPVCGRALKLWNLRAGPPLKLAGPADIPWPAAAYGAAAGVYGHVLLDSVMHYDVRPFAPLSPASPLYMAVGVEELEAGCVLAGLFGMAVLSAARLWNRRAV